MFFGSKSDYYHGLLGQPARMGGPTSLARSQPALLILLGILHHPRVEIVRLSLKRQVLAIRRRNRHRGPLGAIVMAQDIHVAGFRDVQQVKLG